MRTVNDVHHRLDLDDSEQAAYDAWTSTFTKAKNPKAQNFQILARKLGIDPHFAIRKWFGLASPLSPETSKFINILEEWSAGNRMSGPEFDHLDLSSRPMKPVEGQSKMVIHTHWTSQMPVLLNRLAQNGYFAKTIPGDTPPHLRQAIVIDFQSDQDHLSDPAGWVSGDNMVEFYPPRPCRIIIITSVGAAGINLFRANHLILVDLFFTHQERVQVVGRVARKGQSRACQIHSISLTTPVTIG
jgi:SNF2 family DNA or RNA helicase